MIDLTLILGLFLGAPPDELPAQGKPPAPVAPAAEGERPALSAAEVKMLRDSNIFAPKNHKRKTITYTSGGSKPSKDTAPPTPKPPVVTGLFFDAKAASWIVVLEDRNSGSLKQFKDPKFLKVGEEVAGFKIEAIAAEKVVFTKGEITKELKVGEMLPTPDGKPVSTAPAPTEDPEAGPAPEGDPKPDAKVEIKPIDAETSNKTLEEMRKKVGKKNRPSKDE